MKPNQSFLIISMLIIPISLGLSACSYLNPNFFGSNQLTSQTTSAQPITSPNDTKQYLSFKLNNGLQALVISDPTADKAAASLNVAAGSLHEPQEWPGLAHFLEHLLFLGTEKYPAADAYQSFISQQGGSHNAFTAARDTNYFFDIQPEHLEPALDRLAQFFIAPLLGAEYMAREINAVDSEWSGTLNNDGRLRHAALRHALNPAHPASRFSAGNKESLTHPEQELRPALLDYYQQYYRPERMSLVVIGQNSPSELRQLVERYFAAIPARDEPATKPQAEHWPPLFTSQQLPALLEYQPLRQDYQLQLLFPIPDLTANYAHKASSYLSGLIGHEGQGGLLAKLKDQNWASSLNAGTQMSTGSQSLFTLTLELTPTGDKNLAAILQLVFQHLHLIQQEGIQAWRYAEAAQLADNYFRYSEEAPASNLATHLALNLARYPVQDVIRAPYVYAEFTPEPLQELLNHLTPHNLLVMHTSPRINGHQTDAWLPTKFNLHPLPSAWLQQIEQAVKQPTVTSLPPANSFIPKDLAIYAGTSATQPQLLLQTPGLEVWHGLDTSFRNPRANIYLSLQNPTIAYDLSQRLLARLAASWLNDQLNAPAYPARLAGLSYDVYAHARGLTLVLGGFNEQQPRLANLILQELRLAQVDEQQFQRLQQRLKQNLHNLSQERLVQQLVRQLYDATITPGGWSQAEQIKALEQLTATDLRHFLASFSDQLYIQILAWGNVQEATVLDLAQTVQQQYQPQLEASAVDIMQARQLDLGLTQLEAHLEPNDKAVLYYLQGAKSSLEEEANLRLLVQLQAATFFHELRTKQQLGYAVFNGNLPLLQQPGIFYYVQSPQQQTGYLATAIDNFLQADFQRLSQLSSADYQQHRLSLIKQLQEQDMRLSQRAQGFWQEIGTQRYSFNHQQQLAAVVSNLSQTDLLEFYQDLLRQQRGSLLIHSAAKPD